MQTAMPNFFDEPTMQLYLIRHAESDNNAKPTHERVEDPGLTMIGDMQAQHLSLWLKTLDIDSLITSPFLRTLRTTKAILDIAPQPVCVWHDVFERGGCFRGHGPNAIEGGPGLGRGAIASVLGHECIIDKGISDEGWWAGKPRETDEMAFHRAALVHARLIKTFGGTDQTVVVITHADFKRILLKELLGKQIEIGSVGLLNNTGVSRLCYVGKRWRLDWLNAMTHLPARLITGKEH